MTHDDDRFLLLRSHNIEQLAGHQFDVLVVGAGINGAASAAPIVSGMGLRRCEIEYMAEYEMVVTLEDLLRRRSKLGLLVTRDVLRASPELSAVCKILFGEYGPEKLQAYFNQH